MWGDTAEWDLGGGLDACGLPLGIIGLVASVRAAASWLRWFTHDGDVARNKFRKMSYRATAPVLG